jgi:hypothetical protein
MAYATPRFHFGQLNPASPFTFQQQLPVCHALTLHVIPTRFKYTFLCSIGRAARLTGGSELSVVGGAVRAHPVWPMPLRCAPRI